MKIAMVSEHASPLAVLGGADAGGQNVHVAELSAALARGGHHVIVYTRRDDAGRRDAVTMPSGVVVRHVAAGPPSEIPKDALLPYMDEFATRLHAAWRADVPDLVHAHFWMSARASLVAARPLRIPVIVTFHALGSEKRRMQGDSDTSPRERLASERSTVAEADAIVATSSAEIFELCRLGADPRRLKIVPCGVDFASFDASRDALELPRLQPFRAVTLSRLVRRKGVDDVIDALARVPGVELIIAGGPAPAELGHDEDTRRLARRAGDAGVADRVTLVGRVARPDVPRFLRAADVVVCAAHYEPFGIVPLEAMAAGRPVIATAVGGQNDTVIDRFTGLHVPPEEPRAIAAALRDLMEDPAAGRRFGEAGRMRAQQRFTWDRIAAETTKVYRSLDRTRTVTQETA